MNESFLRIVGEEMHVTLLSNIQVISAVHFYTNLLLF